MPRFISKTHSALNVRFLKMAIQFPYPASGSRKKKKGEENTRGESRGEEAERSHGAPVPCNVVRINSN